MSTKTGNSKIDIMNHKSKNPFSGFNIRMIFTLVVLGLAWGSMYVYPYIRYVFAGALTSTLNITETQAGLLITVYGVVSLFLYIPGGIIADKLRAKFPLLASMAWALLLLVFFALIIIFFNDGKTPFFAALFVWALMPFATAFVFWSSLMKAIALSGNSKLTGRAYGICFAANAIFGTIISSTNMLAYTKLEPLGFGFVGVTLNVALFILIALILLSIFLKNEPSQTENNSTIKVCDVKQLLRTTDIWLASIAMMLIYMMLTCTTYFTNYMMDICKLSIEISGALTIFRTYFIMIFAAIFSGIIADKIFHSTVRWFKFASICMLISTIIFIVFGFTGTREFFGIPNNIYVIAAISILPGIFSTMIYAIQFSILRDIAISPKLAGTAAGVCSMFVFSPDIWFNTLLGNIIDTSKLNNTPEVGYAQIFAILIAICLGIFIICSILNKRNKEARNI